MIPFKKFIPGIAWFFFLLIMICLPGEDLPKADDWMSAIMFDKWVHVGLFSLLALFFMQPFIGTSLSKQKQIHAILKIAVSVSIWGLTSEFIQKYFIPGRSFDLLDWAADSAGALLAFWVCLKRRFNIGFIKTIN